MPQKRTVERICECCKIKFLVTSCTAKRGKGRFCSQSCQAKILLPHGGLPGERNHNWKGGLIQSKKGYFYVYKPDHPRAKGNYVKRADLVLEKKLGRPLKPNEIAHHGPGGKEDDSPENLSVMTKSRHTQYHISQRPRKHPKRIPQPNHPSNRRYTWPSDKKLLNMQKKLTLRQIAEKISCTFPVVFRRIKKLNMLGSSNGRTCA